MKIKGLLTKEKFYKECAKRMRAYNKKEKNGFWFRDEDVPEIMQEILIDGDPAPYIDDKFDLYEDLMDATSFSLSHEDEKRFDCSSIVVIDKYEIDEDGEHEYVGTVGYLFV